MLLRVWPVAMLIALSPGSNAQTIGAASVDPVGSEIRFVSRQMNVPIEGRFRKFSGTVRFDPEKPESTRAQIKVDLGSIDAGSDDATVEVQRKSWFDVAAFPEARFVATGAKHISANRYEATGQLSIKGIKRKVAVPFTVSRAGDTTTYEGDFALLRLDFSVGEGEWSDTETVANEVDVRFRLVVIDRQ